MTGASTVPGSGEVVVADRSDQQCGKLIGTVEAPRSAALRRPCAVGSRRPSASTVPRPAAGTHPRSKPRDDLQRQRFLRLRRSTARVRRRSGRADRCLFRIAHAAMQLQRFTRHQLGRLAGQQLQFRLVPPRPPPASITRAMAYVSRFLGRRPAVRPCAPAWPALFRVVGLQRLVEHAAAGQGCVFAVRPTSRRKSARRSVRGRPIKAPVIVK